jgi:hypothetical protein
MRRASALLPETNSLCAHAATAQTMTAKIYQFPRKKTPTASTPEAYANVGCIYVVIDGVEHWLGLGEGLLLASKIAFAVSEATVQQETLEQQDNIENEEDN